MRTGIQVQTDQKQHVKEERDVRARACRRGGRRTKSRDFFNKKCKEILTKGERGNNWRVITRVDKGVKNVKKNLGLVTITRDKTGKIINFSSLNSTLVDRQDSQRASLETWSLSFFHFLSARQHECLRARVESLSHGSVSAFMRIVLQGATESRISVQAELKFLKRC